MKEQILYIAREVGVDDLHLGAVVMGVRIVLEQAGIRHMRVVVTGYANSELFDQKWYKDDVINVDKLLNVFERKRTPSSPVSLFVLVLTKRLAIELEGDLHWCGGAARSGRAALVSVCAHSYAFESITEKLEFITLLTIHEIGHLLNATPMNRVERVKKTGGNHCANRNCVMQPGGISLLSLDRRNPICWICLHYIEKKYSQSG